VTIEWNQTLHPFTATYIQQTGGLQVTIEPEGARSSGAQRRVDSGEWRDSGYTATLLPMSEHTVSFKDAAGWNKPADVNVTGLLERNHAVHGHVHARSAHRLASDRHRAAGGAGRRRAVARGQRQLEEQRDVSQSAVLMRARKASARALTDRIKIGAA
jgi:hypothetical protein